MFIITDDQIQEIKEANDIVDVIGSYVKLRKAGKNFEGICPFHEDKTPSLRVYPDTQSFYCFGCGAGKVENTNGSDVISFIQAIEHLEWEDAIKFLANRAQIVLEHKADPNGNAYKNNIDFSRQCFVELYTNDEALAYLYGRGLDDDDINLWRIGFCKDDGDYFHDRIMLPILDIKQRTIGFTSRKFPDSLAISKCKHSETSNIFKRNNILYGLNLAMKHIKNSKEVHVVEGPFDCIAMHKMGLKNTVATLGCEISEEQVNILAALDAKVIFTYDGDGPGLEANIKACNKMVQKGVAPMMTVLPDGLDPNELMLKCDNVSDAIKVMRDNTRDYCYYKIEEYARMYDEKLMQAKIAFYSKAGTFIDTIPDGSLKNALNSFMQDRTKGGV